MFQREDRLMNTTQAAAYFGISERCIYNWRKAGRMPPPDVVLPNGWKAWRESTLAAQVKPSAA